MSNTPAPLFKFKTDGCNYSKLRSGILNISKKKVPGYPRIKKNANGAGPPNLHNATREFKKMWGKDGKSNFFDRQAVIFYDDPMEAIT